MGEGGLARQTPAVRPYYHPGPTAAATKDPSTPASAPATADRWRSSSPTPPPRGGRHVTWSPGVQQSCQPQVHGLSPPPGFLRVYHHTPLGESNQNPQRRKRPTPVGRARSASLCFANSSPKSQSRGTRTKSEPEPQQQRQEQQQQHPAPPRQPGVRAARAHPTQPSPGRVAGRWGGGPARALSWWLRRGARGTGWLKPGAQLGTPWGPGRAEEQRTGSRLRGSRS